MYSACGSWASLPAEIRNIILHFVGCSGGPLAGPAAVSREWHTVLDPYLFSRLSLTPKRARDNQDLLHRKKHLVRYIWYHVDISRYNHVAPGAGRYHPDASDIADHRAIYDSISALFTSLSPWELQGERVLDLTVYSSGEWESPLDFLEVDPDDDLVGLPVFPPRSLGRGRRECSHAMTTITPSFGDGRSLKHTFREIVYVQDLERDIPQHRWWAKLPQLPAITSLVIRQQNRRSWSPFTLRCLLSHLPNLKDFTHEPWRVGGSAQQTMDHMFGPFIDWLATRKLRSLVIFENFNESVTRMLSSRDSPEQRCRVTEADMGYTWAVASLRLEELSVSYMIDADDFFRTSTRCKMWHNLRSLALTSRFLLPEATDKEFEGLLLAAARTVVRMPKLQTLEIWIGFEGVAALFRYQRSPDGRSASITLRGTWNMNLRSPVLWAWWEVACLCGHGQLSVATSLIDRKKIRSHGDAIVKLGLATQVVRPTSLRQIIKEAPGWTGCELNSTTEC